MLYGADNNKPLTAQLLSFHPYNIDDLQSILVSPDSEEDGVKKSMFYFGAYLTSFAAHTEDSGLASINLHFYGGSKVWYVASPKDHDKIKKMIDERYETDDCKYFLCHKVCIVHPDLFEEYGIKLIKVRQSSNIYV